MGIDGHYRTSVVTERPSFRPTRRGARYSTAGFALVGNIYHGCRSKRHMFLRNIFQHADYISWGHCPASSLSVVDRFLNKQMFVCHIPDDVSTSSDVIERAFQYTTCSTFHSVNARNFFVCHCFKFNILQR